MIDANLDDLDAPVPDDGGTDPGDEAALWQAFRMHANVQARCTLIERHLPLARIVAAKLYAGRFHDEIEFEDYHQLATVGLIEAIDRFDPAQGAKFRTFASLRVRGAVLNGLERLSERQQQISVQQRLRAERAASFSPDDAAIGPERLLHVLAEAGIGLALGMLLEGSSLISEEDAVSTAPAPYASVELAQLRGRVRALVDGLPERERQVIRLHYLQHIPFEQIASMFGVTRGRVAQLHRQALNRLKTMACQIPPCDVAW